MVHADKNGENSRNGKGTRCPSPNGHAQNEPHSDDETTVPVDKIRVGRDYQAVCPELQPEALRKPELLQDRALLVWSPTNDIPESQLEDYIVLAKDKYGYNGEQALGMLFWHKHDLDRAVLDLANFTPFPDEWSVEDKVLFEQAFQFHGKSFHRIREMLKDKSIASLVKYYYSWKKTRTRTSLMDKQAKKLNTPREDGAPSEAGSEGGSNEESDHEDKGKCTNCGVHCSVTRVTPKGTFCSSCYQHWRRTGMVRPTSGPSGGKRASLMGSRHKRKPPKGMYINHDDLAAMATGGVGVLMLRAMDRERDSLQRQVQQNKQVISSLKRKHSDSIEELKVQSENSHKTNARWTSEELLLAVQGVRKYGKDFKTIAEVIGNKTEHHVRNFFVNFRKKFNLDNVLEEYEKEHNPIIEDNQEESTIKNSSPESMEDVVVTTPTPTPPIDTAINQPSGQNQQLQQQPQAVGGGAKRSR